MSILREGPNIKVDFTFFWDKAAVAIKAQMAIFLNILSACIMKLL